MWNSGVAGTGDRGAGYAPTVGQSKSVSIAPDMAAMKQLGNELFNAAPSAKSQTAQRLSDSLKVLREQAGGGTFKHDIDKLINTLDVYLASEAAIRQSVQQMFPDAGDLPAAAAPRDSGRAPAFDRPALRRPAVMSNRAVAQRVVEFDYYTDTRTPGRKPGVGNAPGNIWSGFSQGKDGNCITVAATKVAMMRFGQKPTDIFKQVKLAGDGYNVEMRDGFTLHLSKGELEVAARRSDYKGNNQAILADAHFLYAASAKRAQMENNDGYARQSFGHALSSINDGDANRWDGLQRLGLSAHIQVTSVAHLARGQLGVVTHGMLIDGRMVGHSLAVINGREEVWGTQGGYPPTNIYANALALI
ncbi:hypothetical protein AO240_22525 [Pseudomonas sp. ICMP 460]|nr:hypothetical protein AO240_22525 [Pseudomonas sp. ICMP 460]